jgi:hypothetical protein
MDNITQEFIFDEMVVKIANFSKENYKFTKVRSEDYDGVKQVYLLNFTFLETIF